MTHVLPALPYSLDALEPAISAETLALHHDRHHRAYVDKLNTALLGFPQYAGISVEDLLRRLDSLDAPLRTAVRQHGGGHANHSLLWRTLAPAGTAPGAGLTRRIDRSFGSLDGLQQALLAAAAQVFGSGWVFLTCRDPQDALEVIGLPNQDSPLSQGATPVLALDLWEHAYYLQYRQERARWCGMWWSVIDWPGVERNLQAALAERGM